jgi:hypothetical protein
MSIPTDKSFYLGMDSQKPGNYDGLAFGFQMPLYMLFVPKESRSRVKIIYICQG